VGITNSVSLLSFDLVRSLDTFSRLANAGKCRATAIIFDDPVSLPDTERKTDAIQVCLEHSDGYSAEVLFPYEIAEGGRVMYGTTFAQEGEGDLFGKSRPSGGGGSPRIGEQ
jgi:hypothetical protein